MPYNSDCNIYANAVNQINLVCRFFMRNQPAQQAFPIELLRESQSGSKKKKVEGGGGGGGGGEKRKRLPTNPTILENAPGNFTVRFIFKLTACQNRSITNRLSLDYQICKIALFSNQGRPGGVVVYQYTRKKFAKIPKNTQNSSKCTQNYTQVYFIPEIQRK